MAPELNISDIAALSESDLRGLVAELLDADSQEATDDGVTQLVDPQGQHVALVVSRAHVGPALAGLSLPALAGEAKAIGAECALAVTGGLVDPDRRGDLERALEQIHRATGIRVEVLDAGDLLARVVERPDVAARYFPNPDNPAVVASESTAPKSLVKAAVRVAPREPVSTRRHRGWLRLTQTALVMVVLIAVPIHVSACQAKIVGAVGVSLLGLNLFLGWLLLRFFGRVEGTFNTQLAEMLAPLPDQTSLARRIVLGQPTQLALLAVTVGFALLRLSRALLGSAVLIFFGLWAFAYMLLWSFDPATCADGAQCTGAFSNLATNPSVGDFFYISGQAAFFNIPGDIAATSRLAKGLVTGEFIAAAALLANFATTLGMRPANWHLDLRQSESDPDATEAEPKR